MITLVLFFIACTTKYDLNGSWKAYGYECPEQKMVSELVQIKQMGIDVIATKVKGDRCIGGGEVTFEGQIKGNLIQGFMNGKNPEISEYIEFPMKLDTINNDSLSLLIEDGTTITFKRINE